MSKYYFVTRPNPKKRTLTLDDILFDLITEKDYYAMNSKATSVATRTNCFDSIAVKDSRMIDSLEDDIVAMENFYRMFQRFDVFYDESYNYETQLGIRNEIKKEMLRSNCYDEDSLEQQTRIELERRGLKFNPYYNSFFIPKKSGGLRRIDAPADELKDALSILKSMFERFMCGNTYHTSAYAYIPNRSACDVSRKMRDSRCRWFLKTDFSDFFGSINIDFAMRQLSKIYPFCAYVEFFGERGYSALYNCLKLCFLEKKLPQGTPISPLLTNILMIPLDYKISNLLLSGKKITTFDNEREDDNYRLIYARYADDIYIGSHRGFDPAPVIAVLKSIIEQEEAPFVIKPEKTRYCSSAGRNWILGVMLNQNNEITVGHNRKRQVKAMISNFAMDYKNQKSWDPTDIQQVLGNISYISSIEKEYMNGVLENLSNKYDMDIMRAMKDEAYR